MVRAIAKLLLVLQLMHKRCKCNVQHTNKDSLKSEQRSMHQLVLYSEVPDTPITSNCLVTIFMVLRYYHK